MTVLQWSSFNPFLAILTRLTFLLGCQSISEAGIETFSVIFL